jgi:hypothetical protein
MRHCCRCGGFSVVSGFKQGTAAMEEVGNDLSAGAGELVLESAPQMANEVAAEELASAVGAEQPGVVTDSQNAGAGVADGVGNGEFWLSHTPLLPSLNEFTA